MAILIPFALLILPAIFGLLPPHATADHVLYTGEVLMAGQNLTNGQYRLAMQSNCDLVLYEGETPTWTASTAGKGNDCYLGLKHNGELVVRRNVHYTLWSSSNKSKKGKYALVLDGHGKLGIYGQRRWASSNQKETGVLDRSVVSTEYVLYSGERLAPPKKLKYKHYELGFKKCNLVISDSRTGKVLWQTSTEANSCYAQLEADGELTVKHRNNRLWSSNKKSENGPYVAVLRFDGRLNVYGPLIWSLDRKDDSLFPDASSSSFPRTGDFMAPNE
ncbi:mannose-specific lectin 2-like [Phoenix dactylifera]|uniref:Mannose-specific lectin 2-like n=1 Tax=Phoenix dactylifera TaxID=42345 RepID=A0A8B7D1W5_PHODC|nr:mannose-specific lectin 2-like [Phoenix dactylifera]